MEYYIVHHVFLSSMTVHYICKNLCLWHKDRISVIYLDAENKFTKSWCISISLNANVYWQ